MKKITFKLSMVVALCLFLLTGCNKSNESSSFDSATIESDNELDRAGDDIDVIVEDASDFAASNGRTEGDKFANCADINFNKNTKTMVIDFGASGCKGRDGKTRKGKMIVVNTDMFRKPNSKCTVTFEGYFVNDVKVDGTVTTTYNGINLSTQTIQKTSLVNIKLTFSDGQTASRNVTVTQSFTLSQGLLNSEYQVTINGTGVARNGVAFTTTTLSPITKKLACFTEKVLYPTSGIQQITPQNDKLPIKIDFGTGACDKEITITRGEAVKVITLK